MAMSMSSRPDSDVKELVDSIRDLTKEVRNLQQIMEDNERCIDILDNSLYEIKELLEGAMEQDLKEREAQEGNIPMLNTDPLGLNPYLKPIKMGDE